MLWRQGDWEIECDSAGGRLTRAAWRGRSLLTQPHLPGGVFVAPDPKWGEYETRPVFGYDDCWPSLAVSAWPGRDRLVRDHGELCWLEWAVTAGADALQATAADPAGEWTFTRTLSCLGIALRFDFLCTNTGQRPLCMSWAGHALVLPASVHDLLLPEFERVRCDYPAESGRENEPADAAQVWPFLKALPRGEAVMLVLEHCQSPALTVLFDGARWTMAIEGVERPSLGLWYNAGGYPPEPGLQREEFGLEWMLTPECALEQAAPSGTAIIVAPGEACCWAVIWSLEEHA